MTYVLLDTRRFVTLDLAEAQWAAEDTLSEALAWFNEQGWSKDATFDRLSDMWDALSAPEATDG